MLKIKTILLTLFLTSLQPIHSQRIRLEYNYLNTNKDLSLTDILRLLKKEKNEASSKKDTSILIQKTLEISSIYRSKVEFGLAFNSASEALLLSEKYTNPYFLAKSHEH